MIQGLGLFKVTRTLAFLPVLGSVLHISRVYDILYIPRNVGHPGSRYSAGLINANAQAPCRIQRLGLAQVYGLEIPLGFRV